MCNTELLDKIIEWVKNRAKHLPISGELRKAIFEEDLIETLKILKTTII